MGIVSANFDIVACMGVLAACLAYVLVASVYVLKKH